MAKELTKNHPRISTGTGTITGDYLNLNGTQDGSYLIYDDTLGRFKPTNSTVSPHNLLGAQHSDTDDTATPSYGDSIYYNGTEWTTGNFGNWGADMEYVAINGASNVTYNNLTWTSITINDVENFFGQYFTDRSANFTNETDSSEPYSGSFSPRIYEHVADTNPEYNANEFNSSRVGFSTWNNRWGTNDDEFTLSCSIQFPLSELEGTALVNENIRGLYIRVHNWIKATNGVRESKMYITYPDGTKKPLLVKDMVDTEPDSRGSTEFVTLVPVNEGQTEIEIDIDLDRNGAEGLEFEIIGAQCTKKVSLSPDVDFIQIKGSKADDDQDVGYVDLNSATFGPNSPYKIWYSENNTQASKDADLSWSDVLPLVIPNNVSKTVIRGRYNWSDINTIEEMSFVEVIIDWTAKTIHGNNISNYEHGTSSFLPKQQIVDDTRISFIDYGHNGIDSNISIKISGRSITELPWPQIGSSYDAYYADIYIENYKTIADATTKLNSAPHFNTRVADANNLTNPSEFATLNFDDDSGSCILEFKIPSYGSPTVLHYHLDAFPMASNSICWTMKVNVLSTTMINQFMQYVDDSLRIYVDGILQNETDSGNAGNYGYDSGIVPTNGLDHEWYSYELTPGEHIIQYVYNDSGNGNRNILMMGDIISDTVEFVNGDYIDTSTP